MEQTGTVEQQVRDFVTKTFFFDDAEAAKVEDSTDLVELGVLDSMNVLQLVDFMEVTFDFELDPEDLFLMTTLDGIVKIIRERTSA